MGNRSSKQTEPQEQDITNKSSGFKKTNAHKAKEALEQGKAGINKDSQKEKELTREKRKHYLNRLSFVNKRESYVENNILTRHSIGATSYYESNMNLFDEEAEFSNYNYENMKFSNSFVEDYNPNNGYINNYLNSHCDAFNKSQYRMITNDSAHKANTTTELFSYQNNLFLNKNSPNRNSFRNSFRQNLSFVFSNKQNNNLTGSLIINPFNYANGNFNKLTNENPEQVFEIRKNNIEEVFIKKNKNKLNNNSFIDAFNININSPTKHRDSLSKGSIYFNPENPFRDISSDKQGYRKNRKTLISNLISETVNQKNFSKVKRGRISLTEENFSNSISSNDIDSDSFNAEFLTKNTLASTKGLCNSTSGGRIMNKNIIASETRNKINKESFNNYAETKNSLFLDLKNHEFFYDYNTNNENYQNLNNMSYSEIRSTEDTKMFDITKPRHKTPVKRKNNESAISISNSNHSNSKSIEFLSKSSLDFDINNKKAEDILALDQSSENISNIEKNFIKNQMIDSENLSDSSIIHNNKSSLANDKNENSPDNITNISSLNYEKLEENKNNSYSEDLNNNSNNNNKNKPIETTELYQTKNRKNNSMSFKNPIPMRFRMSVTSNLNFVKHNISKTPFKSDTEAKVKRVNSIDANKTYDSYMLFNKSSSALLNNDIDNDNYSRYRMSIHNSSKSFLKNEYRLNFIRKINSEDLRKNYIAKLIYKQIWEPSKKPKNHNSIIIFDWDDTLLCTSFITPNGIYKDDSELCEKDKEMISQLEISVSKLLSLCIERGDVFIITNAAPGWIEYSAEKYYPSIKEILKKVNIISARGEYEKEFPGDSRMWKIQAFLNMQKNFDSCLITNIICFGDSFIEMEAAQILASKFSKAFIKSIKFRENPKPDELHRQICLVYDQFLSIYSSIKNLTIRVEKKIKK